MRLRMLAGAVLGLALAAASFGAQAAPITFTWNPSATGLPGTGPSFMANNITIEDYAVVNVGAGGAFSEQGLVNLRAFTLSGTPVTVPGLGSNYALYLSFTGTGTQTSGTVIPAPNTTITGTFDTLSYSLLAASGTPTFNATAAGATVSGLGTPVTLATGSLIPGSGTATITNTAGAGLSAGANVLLTFNPNSAFAGFFVDPPATVGLNLFTSVTNTGSVLTTPNPTTLVIDGGGGNATLETTVPVPEPGSLALLGAGLLGLAMFARRRKSA